MSGHIYFCHLLMVYMLLTFAATALNPDCPEGQYHVIGKCRNCSLVCESPKVPPKCKSICKDPDCPEGQYHVIGKCRNCSLVCESPKVPPKCKSICKGWNEIQATPMVDLMQQDQGQPDIKEGVKALAKPTETSISTSTEIGLGTGLGFGIPLIGMLVLGVVLYRRKMQRQLANNAGHDEEAVHGNGLELQALGEEGQEENRGPIQEEAEEDAILMQQADE
ncbi:uncharacterized protein LOC135485931 [Lineus longissimus]|uniref:uncharacterized protein LOC135485931 n=1 Tax=Lineus longissimus TaxID=88925 RepID=UPI00315D0AAF